MLVVAVVLISVIAWIPVSIYKRDLHFTLRITAVIVGVLGIYLMLDRDSFLPFLGESAFPDSLLTLKQPHAKEGVKITIQNLPPRVKVVYWAANSKSKSNTTQTWKVAYNGFDNSGVVMSSDAGEAVLFLQCPQKYSVNMLGVKQTLPQHIHYRYSMGEKSGMFSKIFTYHISC
jgi:hypothetical protein